MSSDPDHYATLQLPPFASSDDIKAAYHAQMKQHHPDHNAGRAEDAEQRAVQIIEAFRVLGDPYRRAHYDGERRRAAERLRVPPRVRSSTAVKTQSFRRPKASAGAGRPRTGGRSGSARLSQFRAAGARDESRPRRRTWGLIFGAALGLGVLAATAVGFSAAQTARLGYPAPEDEPTMLQKQVADLRLKLIADPDPSEAPAGRRVQTAAEPARQWASPVVLSPESASEAVRRRLLQQPPGGENGDGSLVNAGDKSGEVTARAAAS